jgi:AraC family transcriptional regulator
MRFKHLQRVVAYAAAHLDEDVSLSALARHAGLSSFYLHRVVSAATRETPKQLTLRLRLARAAVLLLTSDDSVLDVALDCGFQSHEVFCRAFRRRFGIAPREYRDRGFAERLTGEQVAGHASLVESVGPCIGLYQFHEMSSPRSEMAYSIATKQLQPQPVLTMKRRMKQSEIALNLGEMFGRVFQFAQQNGLALAGAPFARYVVMGPGLMTVQAGLPLVAAPAAAPEDLVVDTLPGGLAAMTVHVGSYDTLRDTHAAIEEWIEAQGLTPDGAPWESYVTDPGQYPDQKDWKTEVYWPVKR